MKKLLFLLLLIPMLAKAQYPTPTGLNPFGSALFLYKIVGSDTLVYAKSSNGLWFPIGRASDIVFSTNFQGLGTLGAPLDLANSIHVRDTVFSIKGMQIGDTLTFTNRNYDAYQKVGSRGGKASFGYSQLDGGGAYIATRTQNDIAHTRAIYAAQNYTRPTYSDDGGATRHFIPVIDTFIGATLDTLTHTLTVTGGGGGVTLAQVDSVKATVETFYNADGALVTSGGFRNVYLSGNEIDFTGSAHNFVVFPSSNLGVGAAPGQSDLGYSLDIFQSGTLGMFQAGNLSVDNAGHAQTATQAARDSSFKLASTQYVDKAIHAGGFGTGTVTSITPGVGFLSHTPITSTGTMDVDTISTIVSKTFAGRYVTASSTNTFTNKSGNVSQWTNNSNYIALTALSATPPIFYNNSTGVISSQSASASQNGYLTSTDWSTFNGKQAALVSGTNIKTVNGVSILGSGDLTVSGGLTSLTPGIGFLSHTPITSSGTMDVDTASTIATKANLGTTYFTESSALYWAFGHSYPVGYPGITANSYPTLVSTALSKTGTNYGISGSGFPQQLSTYYFKEYSGTATADNQTNRAYITIDAGLNELKSKNLPLTKNGFKGYIETILAHHFSGGVILAADLTHTAGWTSVGSANTYVSKSGYLSAQTKSPLVSSTTTDSVTALNFRVQNGLVIGYLGGSPATQYGSVKVYVDNVLVSTISEQNQADSTTRVPVSQSGFTISNNNRVSKATVIWSVLPGYHKVVIKAATGGTNSTLDFIGTLDDPINCHVASVAHQNHLNATGYALFNTGLSNSDVDYFNASIDTAVAVFVSRGYPVNVMKIENYVTSTDLGSDSVHLTSTGYAHMATGFEDSYASALKTRAKIANGVKYAIPVFSNVNTITFSSSLMSTDYKRFLFNGPTDDGNTPVQIQANGTSSSNSVLKVKDSGGALLEDFRENGDIFLKNSAQLNFFTNSYYIKAASGLQLNAGDFINFQVSGTTVGTIRPGGLVIGTSSPLTTSIFDAPSNSKGTTPFPRLPTSTRNSINGTVLKIYIVSGGTSYATAPTLSFSSGSATATCTVSGGVINTVTITGAGSGYTPSTIPTITVTPTSGGSGAILIAAIVDQGLHTYNTDNNTDNVYGQNGWSSVDASQGNDLTAQTSTGNISTFLVGTATATFNVSAYLNVTAISTDVIQIQVTYTDENNTAQTISLNTVNSVTNANYSPVTIRAKNATTITVKTNLTVGAGSVTFDAGARITQL